MNGVYLENPAKVKPASTQRLDQARILIYSHDSFGLGHLRRCRAIAHSLVAHYKGVSVLILSGSPIIGSFDFRARVDFVRIPGVIKLKDGEYTSLALHIDLEQTLNMRESIIYHTAASFDPDIFLVDKEPTGLKGEVVSTLKLLSERGKLNILGLRDIMDEASALKTEWQRKQVAPVLADLYHHIWVYGPPQMGNPIASLGLPEGIEDKVTYTGYLKRDLPSDRNWLAPVNIDEPYILVTAGGGGDGEDLIDWVISAYENDQDMICRAVIVTGPFMAPGQQQAFHDRCDKINSLEIIEFDNHIELLMARAEAIIAMGGYNTFCEILSFDKKALIVPRSVPRKEQLIRAQRASKIGLISMIDDDTARDPQQMAKAIRGLTDQLPPSAHAVEGLLGGHECIADAIRGYLKAD